MPTHSSPTPALRLALVGYGRMGQTIDRLAQERGHEVVYRIDRDNQAALDQLTPQQIDAVIEFTHPEAVLGNLRQLLARGVSVVTGTTGWSQQKQEIKSWVQQHNGTVVYAANFSLGVNLLFAVNRLLARWMNPYPEYDPYVEEQHHTGKADSPSGTALHLANDLLAELDRKRRLALPGELNQRPPEPDELSLGAVRAGDIPGTHRVAWRSRIDTLELQHTAHTREGFALGAVVAAEKLRPGMGLVPFADLLELNTR